MAYTRRISGAQIVASIKKQSDGTFDWELKEAFTGADVDSKTADQQGILQVAQGGDLASYDLAAAALKTAVDSLGGV
tara:strand:- start:263 stop:493 length:231 start_codon:yes stop_codon:yes gene_type:complete